MSHMHAGYVASLLLLATACADQQAAAFQEEPAKAPPSGKSEPKAAPKSADKKGAGRDLITVQFKITLEGETEISLPSSVELKASEPDCEKLDRTGSLDAEGLVTVSKVPACKTAVWIFITGLDSKVVLVDLAKYMDKSPPIQILVSKQGEVTVQN
jgi:hypothetical protein